MPASSLLYAAAAVFAAGNLIRIVRIATMPVHVRWELYPLPHGLFQQLRAMLAEVFFMRGIWEHNRAIWLCSWLLHVGLYLLIIGAGMTLLLPARAGVVFGAACGCGAAGTLGMIALRAGSRKLRGYSPLGTFFNLLFLFAIFASGLFRLARVDGAQDAHVYLVAAFLVYFPFTHMAHMFLKYFTYHSVRWDDHRGSAKEVSKYLGYPVSWSAPHIQGKTWADVVKK